VNVWVVLKGEYADSQVVGVLTDQTKAEDLARQTRDLVFDDAVTVLGPFQPAGSIAAWLPREPDEYPEYDD